MLPALRHQNILAAMRSRGGLSVADLAEDLGVSASTIRRDLSTLEDEGVLQRTFGGAVLLNDQDDPLDEVQLTNATAKHAIANAAAALIEDEMTVIIDIGSTTLATAQLLRGRGLTIVTASLPAFHLFEDDATASLLLLGGRFRSEYRCTAGQMTVDALTGIRADVALLGCSGVAHDGTIRDNTLDQVAVKRALINSAAQGVLLADRSKFPGKGTYAVAPLSSMATLVTDLPDSTALRQQLAGTDTRIVTP